MNAEALMPAKRLLRNAAERINLRGESMDFNQIQAFLAVCNYKGFTSTSRHLHINQSTLSRWIAAMEEELGATLLCRTAQGIELTEAGALFRKEGAELLQRYQGLRDQLIEIGSGASGHIRVGMPMNLFGQNSVLGLYNRELEIPGVEIQYNLLDFETLNNALLNRGLDVAITYDFAIRPIQEELVSKFVFKEPFVFFVRRDHLLCREENVTISKLGRTGLAVIDTNINPPFLNHVLHQIKMMTDTKIRVTKNHESLLMEVSIGNFVGVCPKTLYESFKEIYGIHALPVTEIDTSADFVLAWRRDNDNPLIRVYNDHIRSYIWNKTR